MPAKAKKTKTAKPPIKNPGKKPGKPQSTRVQGAGVADSPPKNRARSAAKAATPPPADNRSIYLKFVEQVLNGGNFAVAPEYLAPEVTTHNGFPGQLPGIDGFVAALKAFHGAFPDLHVKVTHVVAEGEMVVARFEVTGTHRGTFLNMPASGRKIHYEEIAIVRLADGKVAEHWSVADALAILQQLQASEIS